MKILAFGIFLFLATSFQEAAGQTESPNKTVGDRAVERAILAQTRELYGKDTAQVFLTTSDNVLRLDGPLGTELQGALVGSDLVRVFVMAFTKQGKYGAEYYMRDGNLLYVYETLEYFQESAPARAWQNFKHIAAWERRSYFRNGIVAYGASRGKGAPEPGADGKNLQEQSRHLARLLASRPQVPTPPAAMITPSHRGMTSERCGSELG